ncbi:MAG: patatin-like phospholipase family protein [Bacilli bacterium]|nr:patatin-like phospholipase family protein [Bacilli bacterium]MBR2841088.1 patatin-like phospholipase family protein [Bacilli bacterium]
MEKLGLVLSGGGSKGSYEIGVYKALKKLKIKPDIVTGTSIGAINGIFITQKQLLKAIYFWRNVDFEKMYREEDFPKMKDPELKKVYAQYIKTFISEGGMDVSKIEKIFSKVFNPKKFFKSDIDYGLVTYNWTKKKPVIMKKKDLTKENTKSYVLASSACYPAYKPYIIDGESYIDGGYHDNIPINLAIEMGATKIIAVDLRAIGLKKRIKDKSIEVTYIAPRNKIGSFLVFETNQAKRGIKLGYNDTMKTFNELDGNKFTFKKGNLVKNYNKYNDIYEDILNDIFKGSNNIIINRIFKSPTFKEIINRKTLYKSFNNIVEKSGEIFKFDDSNIYNIKSYNKGLINNLSNTEPINIDLIVEKLKNKELKKVIDSRKITKYFYNSINSKDKSMIKFIPLFRTEFLSALYIYTVKNENETY